jgi:hypothetical protein
MSDDEAAALLGVTREQFRRLATLPTFPQVRARESLEAFKQKRDEAAAQWQAA